MITYDIVTGKLYAFLDTHYDSDFNLIEMRCDVNWTADNEEIYRIKEKVIDTFKVDNELFLMVSSCDWSGYEYWVFKQEEPNYVNIDIYLKKKPHEYTQDELRFISSEIIKANDYFREVLN